jgi:hypothetical protein
MGLATVAGLNLGILCALGLACVTWSGCSDDAAAEPTDGSEAQGIPVGEFDLFANLIHNIDKAQADYDAAKKHGNRAIIRNAGALLAEQQQILTQLYVDKHGVRTVANWAEMVRAASSAPSALIERPPSLQELEERLSKLGALGLMDEEGNMYDLNCANIKLPADLVKHFGQFKHLKNLNLSATGMADKDLAHLKSLKNLHTLNLSRNPIHGIGLQHLKEMAVLEVLNLSSTMLNDQALPHLEGINHLKKIRALNLESTTLTTKGYERVTRLFRRANVRF